MITLVIALILVLMIINNISTERRIRALERRWNEFIDSQRAEQTAPQGSLRKR